MPLFNNKNNTTISEDIAIELKDLMENELIRQINIFNAGMERFWKSDASPQEILTALGNQAGLFLALSDLQREHLKNIIKISTKLGLALFNDIPEHEFSIFDDGTAIICMIN